KTAPVVVEVKRKLSDLFALNGVPVRSPMNLDELRKKDIPPDRPVQIEGVEAIDPLSFFVGRVAIDFTEDKSSLSLANLANYIDRSTGIVKSATGELLWDYKKGVVIVDSPKVQGVVGFLGKAGTIKLRDVSIESQMEYGTILLVSLDDKPIASSHKLLLQVMSEEKNKGWSAPGEGLREIKSVGTPPIMLRCFSGLIKLNRPDASRLSVILLDDNGYPIEKLRGAQSFSLKDRNLFYIISMQEGE
ncbi:hypothetical protein H5T87_11245, partial [bacterium]|nr:hypothetical protein [bacterium]